MKSFFLSTRNEYLTDVLLTSGNKVMKNGTFVLEMARCETEIRMEKNKDLYN